jgi:hypothetical protein
MEHGRQRSSGSARIFKPHPPMGRHCQPRIGVWVSAGEWSSMPGRRSVVSSGRPSAVGLNGGAYLVVMAQCESFSGYLLSYFASVTHRRWLSRSAGI